ncbi:hypothetical protein UlMin_035563 [Ulmus minor]
MKPSGVRKGAWTREEDILLKRCIENFGVGKWNLVPSRAGLNRCRKSCRLRWLNYLKPDIKRGDFAMDEVDLLLRLHKLLGNRWSLIAGRIPGRTANDVKNYWNTHLRKKMTSREKHKKLENTNDHQKKPKSNVIKPRPRTFSKQFVPLMNKNETTLNQNSITPPRSDQQSELSRSHQVEDHIKWWENLLDDVDTDNGRSSEEEIGPSLGSGLAQKPISNYSVADNQVENTKDDFILFEEETINHWIDFSLDDVALWDLNNREDKEILSINL